MKPGIHPEYREVVFQDAAGGLTFKTRSAVRTDKTIVFEGKTYPLVSLEISSASHPFFTGTHRLIDSAGRVERFRRKYAAAPKGPGAKGGATQG